MHQNKQFPIYLRYREIIAWMKIASPGNVKKRFIVLHTLHPLFFLSATVSNLYSCSLHMSKVTKNRDLTLYIGT